LQPAEPALHQLATEQTNPATTAIDTLPALEIVRLMNEEDRGVPAAVERELPAIAEAIDAIAARLAAGGRLIYVGAGTSGRLGMLDASECSPTFSAPPEQVRGIIAGGIAALTRSIEGAEDDAGAGRDDLLALSVGAADAVVGLSASGRAPYVLAALDAARQVGAFTAGVCCTPGSALAAHCDITIAPLVGPEVLAGSTRLKAGTAQKLVLNMLSTGAMVRLGKCYGNLMVDMQATNAKLRDRAARIVSTVAEATYAEAWETLELSGFTTKVAISMLKLGIGKEEAQHRLSLAGGHLRDVIGD